MSKNFWLLPCLSLVWAACAGEESSKASATTCTVEERGDGTALLRCPDDIELIVKSGADGASGADGDEGADGNDGATGVPGSEGAQGRPGADREEAESCVISRNANGTHTLACGAQSIVIGDPCEEGFPIDIDSERPRTLLLFQMSNCTWVRGSVDFRDYANEELPRSLSRITRVDSDLWISGSGLLQAVAFPQLREVGGDVYFYSLPALETLDLSRLEKVGDDLEISDMEVLHSLDLSRLEEVDDGVYFYNLSALETIELPSLREVGGALEFEDNGRLSRIGKFPALESVGRWLTIGTNAELEELGSFEALTVVGGIQLWENHLLERIPEFPALAEIRGFGEGPLVGYSLFLVSDHDNLTSIGSLGSVSEIDGSVTIRDNPMLPQSIAETLFDDMTIAGTKTICSNDGPGC